MQGYCDRRAEKRENTGNVALRHLDDCDGMHNRPTMLLLNVGHAIDHMFLLIFATAVTTIALEFGFTRWEDLMPYSTAAFFFFGVCALPAGRLGDHWGRRSMMILFFVGMGGASILVSLTQSAIQLALALALLGCFAAIYHPVGIPMLVQGSLRPGWTIGVNGFAGNLGVACSAVVTGYLVKYFGWRMAFVVPGLLSIACGFAFARAAKIESVPPARRVATQVELPASLFARVMLVLTLASTGATLLFNFSTNGNYELLRERFAAISRDPADLGLMLAGGRGKVLSLEECHLTAPWFAELLLTVRTWWEESGLRAYHHRSNEGSLRTLIVREGQRTGDKMVMLTVSGNPDFALTKQQIEGFTQVVKGMVPEASIFLRIQQIAKGSPTQFFEIHLSGPDHIQERLHIDDAVLTFKISPSSFFQPNTLQAEKLYSRALQMADVPPQAHVLDLYCGTGTLGMAWALLAGQVTGVELNPYAVFDAQANAKLNQMSNFQVLCGDVGALLPQLTSGTPPDLVVLDPPRSGLDSSALKHLIALAPEKILYISCNPNTQAENIHVLAEAGYQLLELQPVDQFPHTVHIENIALLQQN